eukprot:gnl/MRDRNA2_/MRDRNA2_86410_c0_seq1.p1 gnl/MRDRNA2_/MRDRNA2_86410_c0~~gnl/MRDRNA2_/MRDRNA2_86410_c0_seq1.p1  ORF type:complete len:294 (-),score=59.03 gnl/MRDRNA2_/MRDRNA2_86410_c0_seq1:558-1439(-)
MNMVLVLAILTGFLASQVSGAAKCGAGDNNGFEKATCGSGDQEKCCHPSREACLVGTPKGGKEQSSCSKTRALYGTRLTKVIIIPACAEILLVFLLVHMVLTLKKEVPKPRPTVALLCFLQTLLSTVVVLSSAWKFGLYSAFLSLVVFHATLNQKQLPKWAWGGVVALQLFNVLAIVGGNGGATNGVFLPLGMFAADGSTTSWTVGMIDSLKAGATCSTAFEDYFTLDAVEIGNEGADPEEKYFGLCTDAFIGAVVSIVAVKMVIQFIMTGLCAKLFAVQLAGKSDSLSPKAV